jgi:two-component system, LytTR family, response regulator
VALTALIVDDEPLARAGLRMLLADEPDVAAVYDAASGRDAVAAIRARRPDLVFLDVQMPEMDGFAVLRDVGAEHMPAVVFVTAHDRYALRAFDVNAIDYLLKPVTRARFATALERVRARLPLAADASRRMASLLETLASPGRYVQRLAVRETSRTFFVMVDDVDWVQAAENYVELHVGGASHLLQVPLRKLESCLDPAVFLRIHRSIVVNIRRVADIEPAGHGEYTIRLQTGVRLQSGRTYHDRIRALLANPF